MSCKESMHLRSSLSPMGGPSFSGAPGKLHASTFCLLVRKLIQSGLVPELVCIMKVIIPDCQTQHSRRLMATCAAVVFARVQQLRGKSWENKHFLHLYLLSRCLSFFTQWKFCTSPTTKELALSSSVIFQDFWDFWLLVQVSLIFSCFEGNIYIKYLLLFVGTT